MIALPEMLIKPAQDAGITVPPEKDAETYEPDKYPLFHLFCLAQIGRSLPSPISHWTNAHVIARVPHSKIKKITMKTLEKMGFE
jgi:hypothetical protein